MPTFRFPYQGAPLLGALLRNESGGRNIPNVHQGTSSGQAQGYFQITTGTWDEFGGRKYASNPLGATYAQQAEIASKIPLRRWDKSTLAAMRGTGKPIDPNRTLGENLAAQGEAFGAAPAAAPATITPGGTPPASDAPPPVDDQLTGADKARPLSGLLGEMARSGGGGQMQPMQLIQPSAGNAAGGPGGSLADIVQQYLAAQQRRQQPQPVGQG